MGGLARCDGLDWACKLVGPVGLGEEKVTHVHLYLNAWHTLVQQIASVDLG